MAFGSLLFVFLGAPVGILFARRDFLSAFMTCFLPIIGFTIRSCSSGPT